MIAKYAGEYDKVQYDRILMGASAGGLEVILENLRCLPKDFPLPIIIVRHQAPDSEVDVAEIFNAYLNLKTSIAREGEMPLAGRIYLAPPDQHLLLDKDACMRLSQSAKINYSRPSIDQLFESAAINLPVSLSIAIVMTGANDDGAAGLKRIDAAGGLAIVQSPASAECDSMPKAALKAVPEAKQLWRNQIGGYLWDLLAKKQPN